MGLDLLSKTNVSPSSIIAAIQFSIEAAQLSYKAVIWVDLAFRSDSAHGLQHGHVLLHHQVGDHDRGGTTHTLEAVHKYLP